MKHTLILFLWLLPYGLYAQLLDNSGCQVFSETPFFNQEFIRQNKIKKIEGQISTKKTLQAIEQRNLVTTYIFDRQGYLVKQYRSFHHSNKKDTTVITYQYDSGNNIINQRTSDSYGFFSYNYKYNNEGICVEKSYCRDENVGKNKNEFVLGKQHIILKETFDYEKNDSTVKQHTYNRNGKRYQTLESFYNKEGYLTKQEKTLIINKKKSKVLYRYDDKGNVSEKITYPYANDTTHYTKITYQYDDWGDLEYIDEYIDNKHTTHKEVLYDKSTLLMKALLIQDIETNFIKIIKYKYEYFE